MERSNRKNTPIPKIITKKEKELTMDSQQEPEVKWERWHKKRIFVRELSGKYAELLQQLYEQPRVYKSKTKPFKGGPNLFVKHPVNPQEAGVLQSIEGHIDVFSPGSHSQKHGHMNSAVFYIMEGKGHEIHDGHRLDWASGDAVIVRNACVHQHFNDEQTRPARVLVFKAKPLFLFLHLMFQKNVTYPSDETLPGWENFQPED